MVRQSVKSKSSKDLNHFKINPTIAGVIIIVLSILLFLALISYDRTDITTFSSLSDLFEGGKKHNLLGIVGANLARIFFEYTFGWCAIIFPAWFLYIGVQFYKHAEQNRFFKKDFVIYFQLAFIGALLLAMPESLRTLGHTVDYYPSGAIGGLAMDILVRMFGYTGAIAVFSSYVIALVLIYIPKSSYAVIFSKLKIDFTKFQRSQPLADYDGEVETEREVLLNDTDEEISDVSESEEFDSSLIKELGEEDESDQSEFQEVEIRQEEYDQPAEKTIREIQETIASSEEKTQVDELESIINAIEEVNNNKSQISTADTQPDKSETDHPSFSIEEEVHEKISSLDKAQKKLSKRERYNYPYVDILDDPVKSDHEISEEELWASARQLEEKLTDFKVEAKVVNVIAGPVITMFEIRPAIGVRVSKIESLMPDIALKMRARGIRFLGQLPGKDTIGVEIPNAHPKMVYFKEIINSEKFIKSKSELPVALGKMVNGEILIWDLADMPHLLVAGATGSGKSVGLNSIIASLLFRKHPDDLKFVMIDPKMLELGFYNQLQHHHLAYSKQLDEKVVTKPENAVAILHAVVGEMERRYRYLADVSVRNIKEYNDKIAGKPVDNSNPDSELHPKLPYIVVIVDELADLMLTSGKDVEEPIARLTQKARAIGIHCIIATQRPSVDVITGVIKANIPTRMAFQTASKIDSRTILDLMGAEQLLGKGDMLFLPPGQAKAVRVQNAFLTTEETEKIVDHIKRQEFSPSLNLPLIEDESKNQSKTVGNRTESGDVKRDVLFEEAKKVVVINQSGSISLLQRRLAVGYARAAKLIDQLEDAGVVGPYNSSNAREVFIQPDELDGLENLNLEN